MMPRARPDRPLRRAGFAAAPLLQMWQAAAKERCNVRQRMEECTRSNSSFGRFARFLICYTTLRLIAHLLVFKCCGKRLCKCPGIHIPN